jgi:casein kinase II subunit alpha
MADNFVDEAVDPDSLHQYIFSDYWIRLTDRAVCSLLDDVKYSCRASTGMRAVLIAAVMCEEVQVYGFGTSAYSGSGTYFQPERHIFRESTLYDYAVERAVMDYLASGEASPYLSGWNVTKNIEVHTENTIARKELKQRWSSYPRLTVFNEEVSSDSLSAFSEHKEPPIELDLGDQIRHVVATTHANVNVGKPLAAIDYRHYKVEYSNNTYSKGSQLGSGTYGSVYLAQDKVNGQRVVLKYLRSIKSKPWLAAREIMLMRDLGGKNHTMPLLDVARSPKSGTSILVLPYISIAQYRKMYVYFQDIHVRYYAFALFDALAYAHSKGIIHNDVKPLNLLVDQTSHEVFLADWGLGEYYLPHNQSLSFHVGTRNWKAPELLWGTHDYTYAVDVWAAGVTFAGWLFHLPHIFDANNNQEMILSISKILGSAPMNAYIDDYEIPVKPDWRERHMKTWQKKSWQSFHSTASKHLASPESYELLDGIFTIDPAKRMTAAEVCAHPYFDSVRHLRAPPAWDWEKKHKR